MRTFIRMTSITAVAIGVIAILTGLSALVILGASGHPISDGQLEQYGTWLIGGVGLILFAGLTLTATDIANSLGR